MAVPGDPGLAKVHQYPQLIAGWESDYEMTYPGYDFPAWFWIKNTGLFWPLLLTALLSPLALRGRSRWLIAAFSVLFLVANLVKFQPWEWDNSKLLVFWYMASGIAVGAVLIRIWRLGPLGAAAAVVMWLTLIGSGVLSLLQFLPPQGPSYVWFSREEIQLAAQIKLLTPPKAIFVTAEEPNNPVADLAGRSVLISYPGWLWSYGINYGQREADLGCPPPPASCPQGPGIYDGGSKGLALLHHYHADYLVVGPAEMAMLHPNVDYFNSNFPIVIRTANYSIYAVPQ
jgi:hypothetical protein